LLTLNDTELNKSRPFDGWKRSAFNENPKILF